MEVISLHIIYVGNYVFMLKLNLIHIHNQNI